MSTVYWKYVLAHSKVSDKIPVRARDSFNRINQSRCDKHLLERKHPQTQSRVQTIMDHLSQHCDTKIILQFTTKHLTLGSELRVYHQTTVSSESVVMCHCTYYESSPRYCCDCHYHYYPGTWQWSNGHRSLAPIINGYKHLILLHSMQILCLQIKQKPVT